ncbi:MAG: archease [Thermoplasmatota archaeon]
MASTPQAGSGFEYIDHTADLAIRAWGSTLEEAFVEAARGIVAYMVETPGQPGGGMRSFTIHDTDPGALLHKFLEEIRFSVETGFVPTTIAVSFVPGGLACTSRGSDYDPKLHGYLAEIKAVTMHGIRVERDPPSVFAVVDI